MGGVRRYQQALERAEAHWFNFVSDGPGLAANTSVCLGTVRAPCEIGRTRVGDGEAAAFTGLSLGDGVSCVARGFPVLTPARIRHMRVLYASRDRPCMLRETYASPVCVMR